MKQHRVAQQQHRFVETNLNVQEARERPERSRKPRAAEQKEVNGVTHEEVAKSNKIGLSESEADEVRA